MDPATLIADALAALQFVLNLIASIKSQGGMTDDQIIAQAQQLTAGNDAAYAQLVAALQAKGVIAPPTPSAAS